MDPADLLEEQYADASNLEVRGAFNRRFSTRDDHPHEWVFDHLDLPADADVLEVGCGPGDFWVRNGARVPDDWTVILTDFSPGMVDEAVDRLPATDARTRFAVAEASRLPLETDAVDAVLANLMLYHVPDLDRTLREIRRVLRPDGRLYASTVSAGNKRALYEMIDAVTDGPIEPLPGSFTLENGAARLEETFSSVERFRYESPLVVTDADFLVAYALSLPNDDALACFDAADAPALRSLAKERLADGPIEMRSDVGLFVASPR